MRPEMTVLYEGVPVGQIASDAEGRMTFRYAESWKKAPESFPLSLSLPLDDDRRVDTAGHRWFANLLPEGLAREGLCRSLGVAVGNDAALLAKIGRDCAGAIQVIREESDEAEAESGYDPVSREVLDRLSASRIPYRLAAREGLIRLSLAGAQDKWPVKWEDGRIFLPRGDAPSTHIVKFPREPYSSLPTNESWTTFLADWLELPVVNAVPWNSWLVVPRYDRLQDSDGSWKRLHQEDFCQALGMGPGLKYQGDGGPGLGNVTEVIRKHHTRPAMDILNLIRWQVLNLLCGNADGHAKNISRMPDAGDGRLAPFYDLVCTAIYPDLSPRLAMAIGGEHDPGQVRRKNWEAMASELGVRPAIIFRELEKASEKLVTQLDDRAQAFLSIHPDADENTLTRINTLIRNRVRRTQTLLNLT